MSLRTVLRRAATFFQPSLSLVRKTTPCFTSARASVKWTLSIYSRSLHDHVQGLDPVVYQQYMSLDIGENVLATYIWIDGTRQVSVLG